MARGIELLHPGFRPYVELLYQVAAENGLKPVVTSTLRTFREQSDLYRRWKSGLSRFPAAKPGTSIHETGLAFDMDVADERFLKPLGELWESFGPGFRWGGRFKDPIHFEYRRPK